jgi:hypothetical protein
MLPIISQDIHGQMPGSRAGTSINDKCSMGMLHPAPAINHLAVTNRIQNGHLPSTMATGSAHGAAQIPHSQPQPHPIPVNPSIRQPVCLKDHRTLAVSARPLRYTYVPLHPRLEWNRMEWNGMLLARPRPAKFGPEEGQPVTPASESRNSGTF